MLGYDMSWASFHVVEVMSSAKVHLKSVGYLAAAQSFEQDTDVLMLTTNLLKKVHIVSQILRPTELPSGLKLVTCGCSCYFGWALAHCYTRTRSRSITRVDCYAESL